MRAVAKANDELKGVFTVDWAQSAPDGSGKPLIPNEVVHALIQHFNTHDLSKASVSLDVLARAYEYLVKQFVDNAGAKAGEFFTPPEWWTRWCAFSSRALATRFTTPPAAAAACSCIRQTSLREGGQHATSAQYFAQEMNWGNAAIGKTNSVLHALEAAIAAGASTITDPAFKDGAGQLRKVSLVLANFPFSMNSGGSSRRSRWMTKRKKTS